MGFDPISYELRTILRKIAYPLVGESNQIKLGVFRNKDVRLQ
jgi:hypothetical protein